IGDSHASVMKPYLDYIGKNYGFSFRTITNDTYANIPGIPRETFTASRFYTRYLHLLDNTRDEIDDCEIIILILSDKSMKAYGETIADFIRSIKPDQALLFLSDFPSLDKNPVRINRGAVKNPRRHNDYTTFYGRPGDEIIRAVDSLPNAFFVDMTTSGTFDTAPFYNDTLMYYDNDHLNLFGSLKYARITHGEFMRHLDAAREYILSLSPES
ncbi:MAG: hypothetical protein LUE10_00780, partial [Alistipes sp.]|nr:hypothetical protein [Alistipes sp.]